ncbi:putative adipose-regulatory protein-domain-containing protein [Biscogniauxia marginata]|nr:putative adipose-regulatory protein-domain-containing protein [Biscogniauxia marginata]
MEYVKAPFRAAVSPKARRTYLGTALFVAASLALLCVAAVAYPVFYYNYVPKKVVSIPVHLQYNAALNPYGVASISPNLMLEQAYDVSVELTLPRSPANLARGNFMVALYALKSPQPPANPAMLTISSASGMEETAKNPYAHVTPDNVVFASRRPALIPYMDPLVSTSSRVLFLLYRVLFAPASSETAVLAVSMGELLLADLTSASSGPRPLSLLLDVQAGQTLQVYSATVTLVARLTGVRWAMYNHRVLSFVVCTTVFWISEMLSMALAWLALGYFFEGRRKNGGRAEEQNREPLARIRREDIGAGDESAGAVEKPGYERLKREGDDDDEEEEEEDVKIKREESAERENTPVGTPRRQVGAPGDADDETDEGEEDEEAWKDKPSSSTTRTGFDDGAGGGDGDGRNLLRRRSSRGELS